EKYSDFVICTRYQLDRLPQLRHLRIANHREQVFKQGLAHIPLELVPPEPPAAPRFERLTNLELISPCHVPFDWAEPLFPAIEVIVVCQWSEHKSACERCRDNGDYMQCQL